MKIVVMVNGAPKGPFDLDGLKRAIEHGEIAPSALACHEGEDEWIEVQNMPELQSVLATKPGDAVASGFPAAAVDQDSFRHAGKNSCAPCPPLCAYLDACWYILTRWGTFALQTKGTA
jgi:hypothetical protein